MDNTGWFQKAKYGLFIHWGLYCMLGGIWQGKQTPFGSEWIMRNRKIPLSEYKKLTSEFNPQNFCALDYVKKAKKWGMKYIVLTAKHHDGFAMYNSKVSDYTIMNTPYGKDIVRQFADACAQENMVFGIYYSQMQDWEDPNGDGNDWDFNPAEKRFETYFNQKVIPQVRELLTGYGKIGLIWFDTPYDMPVHLCKKLAEEVKKCQPDCLINGRIGYGFGDYRQMADNSIPHRVYHGSWEVPMTLNHSWGYSKFDFDFAEDGTVIDRLSMIAGKGGNLLLNIGPDENGEIPQKSEIVLDRVGQWLYKNGQSIYNSEAIDDFPYMIPWGNITYVKKTGCLYFHVKKYPALMPRIALIGLKNKVLSVKLLETGEPLRFGQTYEKARDENRLAIFLPEKCPDKRDTVLAVEIEGIPDIQRLSCE